ncbi:ribbon-helix-helix domain-containing protein [Microbacterium sp. LRZ72]|uniref:ribbon-helix-helix domain-containing protein n=1 Tax=Microbacterium sp. LRZ72 TaxID=2942481 RepID=UPI0029A346C4|nr:ribbon-helix-helix domain-containing protein [Microbacterium sp. LRZ72]MDX2377219.1 ribbon-helix-helix domain-containing protein [Microbacterium sp. LRZ72]
MPTSKVSLSLSDTDIAFLDEEARSGAYASRSAAVQAAVRLLRESRLADAYAEAFREWDEDGWDAASVRDIDVA